MRHFLPSFLLLLGLALPVQAGLVVLGGSEEQGVPAAPTAELAPASVDPETAPEEVAAAPPPPAAAPAPALGDPLDRILAATPGLDLAALPLGGPPPADCTGEEKEETHALMIAAHHFAPIGYSLPGPANDLDILSAALVLRGASPGNLTRLEGESAGLAGLTKAALDLLARTGCGDSVILFATGFAGGAEQILDPAPSGREAQSLADFGGNFTSSGPADAVLQRGPWIILPGGATAQGGAEVLSAAALSDLVTRLRNRGADVTVILDLPSARAFRLEYRQLLADPQQLTTAVLLPNDPALPSLRLLPRAGRFAVLYGTEEGNPGSETPFGDQGLVYGWFTWPLARALSTAPRSTIGALMRAVEVDPDARDRQQFTFHTTDADMDLIAEIRPEAALTGGTIRIDNPPRLRSAVPLATADQMIQGAVLSRGAPIRVEVNGIAATLGDEGSFSAPLTLQAGINAVTVFALTDENELITHSFELLYQGGVAETLGRGRKLALIISNQDYAEGSGLADLATPHADARALATLLRDRYGFATELPLADGSRLHLILEDATQRDIGLVLDRLAANLGEDDSLLIFYAGHGEYEQLTGAAYWLPVDAVSGAFSTYVEASTITRALQRIAARKVLVISDSCYSGMLLRTATETPDLPDAADRLLTLQRLAGHRSRIVLSSGGNTPVLDGGGGGHSVFARALLDVLENPPYAAFSARELHEAVFASVIRKAPQEPDFRPIDGAGHDAGDFVFLQSTQ